MKPLQFGVSYYPELADRTEWRRDLELMASTGFSVIRLLDFAWSALEPRENQYTFDWLDEFLERCGELDFKLIFCTPTAAPPAWLAAQFPDILIERRDGSRITFGGRRDVCVNAPVFRHFSRLIVTRLAERYGRHPLIIGWQLDNELIGSEFDPPECHCAACQWRYRDWLKNKYGSPQKMNAAWGARFWSQEYSDWGEVTTPRNPRAVVGNVLDYARFFDHSNVEFLKEQYCILRERIPPSVWISTNSTALTDRGINHFDYHRALDVAGWDAYFGAAGNPYPEAFAAFAHDLMRSVKNKPFIVFETDCHAVNRAHVAEMVARGAETVLFWHWRMHRFNTEATAPACCDHAGIPIADHVNTIKKLIDDIRSVVGGLPDEYAPSDRAFLHSVDDFRAVQRQYRRWERAPYRRVPCLDSLICLYGPFRQLGIRLDVRSPDDPLSDYDWAILPQTEFLSRQAAERLRAFVRGGGTLFAAGIVGLRDEQGVFYRNGEEPLNDVLGLRLLHAAPESNVLPETIRFGDRTFAVDNPLCSGIVADVRCDVLGRFEESSCPAVFRNKYGRGSVYY